MTHQAYQPLLGRGAPGLARLATELGQEEYSARILLAEPTPRRSWPDYQPQV